MMKFLLGLSLGLNVLLGVLYWRAANRPVLERIIVEKVPVKERVEKVMEPKPSRPKEKLPSSTSESGSGPILADNLDDLERAAEDLEALRKDFFERQEISEKLLRQKETIMQDFFLKSSEIYQKHPTGLTMSFEERRRLIDLEEEAQARIRALFTPKKWEAYKNFVDRYNKKVLEAQKTGESTGILMTY